MVQASMRRVSVKSLPGVFLRCDQCKPPLSRRSAAFTSTRRAASAAVDATRCHAHAVRDLAHARNDATMTPNAGGFKIVGALRLLRTFHPCR